MFYDSWDVSGAMEIAWDGVFAPSITTPTLRFLDAVIALCESELSDETANRGARLWIWRFIRSVNYRFRLSTITLRNALEAV